MSYQTITCILLRCDDCQEPNQWDDTFVPHFDTIAQANESAVDDRWEITDQHQLCEYCAEKRRGAGAAPTDRDTGVETAS